MPAGLPWSAHSAALDLRCVSPARAPRTDAAGRQGASSAPAQAVGPATRRLAAAAARPARPPGSARTPHACRSPPARRRRRRRGRLRNSVRPRAAASLRPFTVARTRARRRSRPEGGHRQAGAQGRAGTTSRRAAPAGRWRRAWPGEQPDQAAGGSAAALQQQRRHAQQRGGCARQVGFRRDLGMGALAGLRSRQRTPASPRATRPARAGSAGRWRQCVGAPCDITADK